jgi:UDP-2,3-diacylglucosamine pyrophosphatase LpxH
MILLKKYLKFMKIKTLFISDVHLGNHKSQADKLLEVFKQWDFENLVIIGDFIDLTSLKKKFFWKESHSTVIQKVLRMSRKDIKVHYVLGNHDYYLRGLIKEGSINLGDITICDDLFWTTVSGEKIYICHGDQFDGFIRIHPFLYVLGDWAYEMSFKVNKIYNKLRRVFGFEYWSLSQYLKSKVKNAITFVNDFKMLSVRKLEEVKCESIMIGHIHTPGIEKINQFNYYNTGDFCESCSYLVETLEGKIVLYYHTAK